MTPPRATVTPLELIELLRTARPDSRHYYLNGGCWELFCLLRRHFPEAEPWHTWKEMPGHVATKIGPWLYDIRGRVRCPRLYEPMNIDSWPSVKTGDRPHRWHKRYHSMLKAATQGAVSPSNRGVRTLEEIAP